MKFEPLRLIVVGAALALLASACSGVQKPPTKASAGTDDKSLGPSKPGEYTSRSMRLFDDAVQSYNEQKKAKVRDWAALEKKFLAVIEADDRFAEAYFDLGVIYERERRIDDAKKAYQRALDKKPSLKQAAENLAVIAQNEGRASDALAIYQEILRKDPDDGAARARMAALYCEAQDYERAMRLAREALMREPQNLTAYKVMIRTYLERNDLNMAKLVAMRATKLSQDPELFYLMGVIAQKEGDEQGAVLQYRQALRERDDYLAARSALAEIAAKHRDWANAGEQYKKIVQYDPKNVAARVNLGLAYTGLGQVDKAMVEYDAALKANPKVPQPYYYLGLIFQKHKDAPEKAIEYYRKFLEVSGGAVPADHPVFERTRECEQYVRQLQESKAAEERAKIEKQAAEARAKKDSEEKKRVEDQKKKEEVDKAKAQEESAKRVEREKREKDAKEVVDAALKAGDSTGAPKTDKGAAKPASKAAAAKPEPTSSSTAKPPAKSEAKKEGGARGAQAATDEPQDSY